jgi:hypothetical protein
MSDILQNPCFLIWTKVPAALEVMRDALSGHIRTVWIDHLETFTAEEIDHLEKFIEDMNAGLAVVKENKITKEKEWVLECGHYLCERLLKKLIEIRTNKKSKKIVWKTSKFTFYDFERHKSSHYVNLFIVFFFNFTYCMIEGYDITESNEPT